MNNLNAIDDRFGRAHHRCIICSDLSSIIFVVRTFLPILSWLMCVAQIHIHIPHIHTYTYVHIYTHLQCVARNKKKMKKCMKKSMGFIVMTVDRPKARRGSSQKPQIQTTEKFICEKKPKLYKQNGLSYRKRNCHYNCHQVHLTGIQFRMCNKTRSYKINNVICIMHAWPLEMVDQRCQPQTSETFGFAIFNSKIGSARVRVDLADHFQKASPSPSSVLYR